MARGATLANLVAMFKAVCGIELDTSITSNEDARIKALLKLEQQWLLGQHAFLLGKARKEVALVAGTRYYDFPETVLDIDRLDSEVWVTVGSDPLRRSVDFGITQEDYQVWDSEAGERMDWVRKWDLVRDTATVGNPLKIEVWPIPESAQTLKLSGPLVLPPLAADGDMAALDDFLIVYFAASKYLARKGSSDASGVLTQAQAHLNSLKATRQSAFERFSLRGGGGFSRCVKQRPIVGVSNSP